MAVDLRDHALAYAARGWPVFPLKPGGKTPITAHGFKDATTNTNLIERLWDRHERANVGAATGKDMKAWVLDVDGPEGSASLTQLENELGGLPETLDQQTGGGGRQLFFAWPDGGRVIGNRTNVRPGIDVRGEGGYVVLPPSIHPSGQAYAWTVDDKQRIAHAPKAWLDLVAPIAKIVPPWERVTPSRPMHTSPAAPLRTPIVERARRYLSECDPAIQGSGGHNALLWAARALVVGFELDDATAIELLWSDFNPRCQPQWNPDDEGERKDLERKVVEARRTPGTKPAGWLLDEFGLRSGAEALAAVARGRESAALMLASAEAKRPKKPEPALPKAPAQKRGTGEQTEFPIGLFPKPVRDFCVMVSDAHGVYLSYAALPVLVVAGAAMGNAWRLELKESWKVPPTLWGILMGGSSQNKSGPLEEIVEPLGEVIRPESIVADMLNPQGDMLVENATLEAVVARLQESRRGLLCYDDEIAGWVKGFDKGKQGKRGGNGDEQAWIKFWNAKQYRLDRKTNNERIFVHAAACSVLGGIQPGIFAECFDPNKFASGLVPRILIACPPRRRKRWRTEVVTDEAKDRWAEIVSWLRCTPFKGLDTNSGKFMPRVVRFDPHAQVMFESNVDALGEEMEDETEDNVLALYGKNDAQAGRLALVHHGLRIACGERDVDAPVTLESAEAGITWARWFLDEQLRVYGHVAPAALEENAEDLGVLIRRKFDGSVTTRQLMHHSKARWPKARHARGDMARLVELGHARWEDELKKNKVILNDEAKKS